MSDTIFGDLWKGIDSLRDIPGLSLPGKWIENWSNPATQLSDRNPLYALLKGDFDWKTLGSKKPERSLERNINNANFLAALVYGGGSALGSLGGGGTTGGATGGYTPQMTGLGDTWKGGNVLSGVLGNEAPSAEAVLSETGTNASSNSGLMKSLVLGNKLFGQQNQADQQQTNKNRAMAEMLLAQQMRQSAEPDPQQLPLSEREKWLWDEPVPRRNTLSKLRPLLD